MAPQIANQGDALFEASPSSGFLKSIFPCLRKGNSATGGSMAWVKLVDDEGRVAGHAVLSARISMALLDAQVGTGGQGDEEGRDAQAGLLHCAPLLLGPAATPQTQLPCPTLHTSPMPGAWRRA